MLFSCLRNSLVRSFTQVGCTLLCAMLLVVSAHAESLDRAIEAYDFKEYQDAAQWLRPWAEQGRAEAQYRLGMLFENGQGVVKNLQDAKKWYREAAVQGHLGARHRLEALGERSAHDGETVAIKWYLDIADQGDANAQYNLAFMYETGFSVPKDYGKAARWYASAAEKKHVLAQLRLGLMYLAGAGVKQSEIQAKKWLSAAGKLDNKLALSVQQQLLGAGPELRLNKPAIADKLLSVSARDEKKALEVLNASVQAARAAQDRERASRDVQLEKGKGIKSALEQDTHVEFGLDAQGRRTLKWYERNAERGVAAAQFQLAKYYELGTEVPVDIKEAVRWYRSAAEQGHAEAQFYFAMLNYYAIGVDRNAVLARSLIKAAAQQGHSAAQRVLEAADAVLERQSMSVWWLTRFGQEQNGQALQQVGHLYKLGRGVRADTDKAKQYYQAAATAGFDAALLSPLPSTRRVVEHLPALAHAESADAPSVSGQDNTKPTIGGQAWPGQSQMTLLFAQPWVKYSLFAVIVLLPILAFFRVAAKEKQRILEDRKNSRRRVTLAGQTPNPFW